MAKVYKRKLKKIALKLICLYRHETLSAIEMYQMEQNLILYEVCE